MPTEQRRDLPPFELIKLASGLRGEVVGKFVRVEAAEEPADGVPESFAAASGGLSDQRFSLAKDCSIGLRSL